MGLSVDDWQDTEFILNHFSRRVSSARKKYATFVEEGIPQGRKEELTGGGLIRSAGGWTELAALRKLGLRQQSDERILGDSDFVDSVLKEAHEALGRKDQYRNAGIGFDEVLQLVAEIYKLKEQEIMAAGKQPLRVQARRLLCYWTVRELGCSVTSVATRLGLGQPAVSRAVQRGERIIQEHDYSLNTRGKA